MPIPDDPQLTDPLTGLSNRWHFRMLSSAALAAAGRGIPFTIVLLEIDGYRQFREDAGGGVGKEAIRHFANLLSSTSREMDLTARLHGARFLSLLRDCDRRGGRIYAERVQRQTRSLQHEYGLTVSMGVAAHEAGMSDRAELVRTAEGVLEDALAAEGGAIQVAPAGSHSTTAREGAPGRNPRRGGPTGSESQPPESDPSESER